LVGRDRSSRPERAPGKKKKGAPLPPPSPLLKTTRRYQPRDRRADQDVFRTWFNEPYGRHSVRERRRCRIRRRWRRFVAPAPFIGFSRSKCEGKECYYGNRPAARKRDSAQPKEMFHEYNFSFSFTVTPLMWPSSIRAILSANWKTRSSCVTTIVARPGRTA